MIKPTYTIITFIFLLSCSAEKEETGQVNGQPNIILIMTDDQGWGDLSMNGNKNIQTPNIDALAENGAVFDRFYVSPVCSPTRAEMLTGRYAVRGGVYSTSEGGERLDLDEKTVAEYLKELGYQTACYGKWHNGMQYPYHPNARGFDDFYGFCSGHWGNYMNTMMERNGELVKGEGFIIDDLTDKGIDFIAQNKGKPFFLYLPYNTPHSPMQVPDEWWDKVKDRTLVSLHKEPELEDDTFTKAVLAFTENIDWNVGRVVQALKENQLEENTIIIYLSDNGPNSWRWNGGMKGKKGHTDEGGVRSPFIVQWKGKLQKGLEVKEITSVRDILPTLTEVAGFSGEFHKTLDGQSLMPLLTNEKDNWVDRYVISHWAKRTSIRKQDFRLDSEDKLYEMNNDPGQTKDVSKQYVDIWEELTDVKERWEYEVLNELPLEDSRTFPVGHPDVDWTQLPARDAKYFGNIQRSNRWPNCSFFQNWTSEQDSISWDVEVLTEGNYEATIYYTCSEKDTGSTMQLSFFGNKVSTKISEAHDPTFDYPELYRTPISVSNTKDFKPLKMGTLHLKKGIGKIVLRPLQITGEKAIDFRLLMLKRVV